MKPILITVEKDSNGIINITEEALQALIDKAYDEGKRDGMASPPSTTKDYHDYPELPDWAKQTNAPDWTKQPQTVDNFTFTYGFECEACKSCSNNPANGGSGICHCTIPYFQRDTSGIPNWKRWVTVTSTGTTGEKYTVDPSSSAYSDSICGTGNSTTTEKKD